MAVAKGQQRGPAIESSEQGEGGGVEENSALAIAVRNGEDLGSFIRAAFENGKPEALIQELKHFVKKREVEIEDLCKLHYEEFIRAVDELRHVLVDAQDLKAGLSEENVQLQMVGDSLLTRLDGLIEYHGTKLNLMQAVEAMKICVAVVCLCAKVNAYMALDRFYSVLRLLDIMERDFLPHLPARVLRELLERQIPDSRAHIQKRVNDEFNDWLVQIRTISREIGQLSIGQVSSARRREEELRSRQREAEEQSRSGTKDCLYILETEDIDDDDSKLKFDLTPVYRAYHINTCLRVQERFRDYYFKNRQLQLNSDLQISAAQSFLEFHQTYFAQLAGFFIVEDRVLRSAGGLVTSAHCERLWESAVTAMTDVLKDQFSRMEEANHLLMVKDYVSLVGVTLRRYGYQVGPLLDVLDTMRDKYHELLLDDCHRRFNDVLISDKCEQMVMTREYEYRMHVLAFQLQTTDVTPIMPYVAPFSAAVPECCKIVKLFIQDSVSFLSYGGHMDYYELVRRYLDKLLITELNETLLRLVRSPSLGVSHAMQIAANLTVLGRACDYFSQHAAKLCGIPMRLVEGLHGELSARSVLRESQAVAHDTMLKLVMSKVDEYMLLTRQINWTPDDPPQGGNDYLHELLMYVDTISKTAQATIPGSYDKVMSAVLSHISDRIVGTLLSDDVKRINIHGITGIDADLRVLESHADEWYLNCDVDKLAGTNLRGCLAEARQLVNLLTGNQPELYLNPVIRQRNYHALDVETVIIVCEKFRDVPEKMFSRNSRQAQKRKSLDALIKQLRDE